MASQTFTGPLVFNGQVTQAGLLNLTVGQIKFPASQNASSDANTLDDYEEGTWTPTFTFVTPGDLSVVYAADRNGTYVKIGRLVVIFFGFTLSTFTFSTSSGAAEITGLPFTADNTGTMRYMAALNWTGITKAGYTDIVCRVDGTTNYSILAASGSGQALSSVAASDMPSGGAPTLRGTVSYLATA